MSKVKVTELVTESVTRSPIELLWTAKNVWEGEEKFLLEKKKISTWHYIV